MGCLTFCRWCCCCFLATVNVLTTILGITFFILGCIAIWGYWVLRQVTDQVLTKSVESMKESNIELNVDVNTLHSVVESLFATMAILFLVLGALMIVIGCLGCYGACLGVPACLIIYAVIVGLVFLAQATVVVIWFADSNIFKKCTRTSLETRVANYKGVGTDVETLQMDILQLSLECCGVEGGSDYYKPGAKWNRTVSVQIGGKQQLRNASYPYSCCKFNSKGPTNSKCTYENVSTIYSNYNIGCYGKLNQIFDEQLRLNNCFYSLAGSLGIDALLIIGALVIYFHKKQEQADIPHSSVQYKMQPQMA